LVRATGTLCLILGEFQMKKTLVALAALAATSAFAQSSVEIYGVVDQGLTMKSLADTKTTHGSEIMYKQNGLGDTQSGSRLGFRGTEEISPGLKATFTLEYGLDPSTDAGVGNNTNGAAVNRQSFVGLVSNAGSIYLGRQYTLHHNNQGSGDPAGNLNNFAGYIGGLDSLIRVNNAVTVVSPTFSGLTFSAQVGVSETISSSTNGATATADKANRLGGIRLAYANGPLAVSYAKEVVGNVTTADGAFFGPSTVGFGVANTGLTQASYAKLGVSGSDRTAQSLAGSFDLGVAKLFFVNNNTKYENALAPASDTTYKANTVGVQVPVGATTLIASAGRGKMGTADDTNYRDVKGYQLGASYALSKRTNLYAYQGQTKVLNGGSANAATLDDGYIFKATAVGIRHSF